MMKMMMKGKRREFKTDPHKSNHTEKKEERKKKKMKKKNPLNSKLKKERSKELKSQSLLMQGS